MDREIQLSKLELCKQRHVYKDESTLYAVDSKVFVRSHHPSSIIDQQIKKIFIFCN